MSRAQRRALIIRDRLCRFPGCAQTRHLKAHHIVAWSRGGPTDLHNLILLCQVHHTAVHEGGMRIDRVDGPNVTWRFLMPDGGYSDRSLASRRWFSRAGRRRARSRRHQGTGRSGTSRANRSSAARARSSAWCCFAPMAKP